MRCLIMQIAWVEVALSRSTTPPKDARDIKPKRVIPVHGRSFEVEDVSASVDTRVLNLRPLSKIVLIAVIHELRGVERA